MKDKVYFGLFERDELNTSTSELLRSTRKQKELSMEQVGRKVGMKAQQLYEIEMGLRPLPPERVPKLARALNIDKETLIDAAILDFKAKFERRALSSDDSTEPSDGDAA